jgi:hypothetical protein
MFSTKQEAHTLLQKNGEHFPLILGSLEGIGYKAKFLYMMRGFLLYEEIRNVKVNTYYLKNSRYTR